MNYQRLLAALGGAALLVFYLPVAQAAIPTCFGRAATIVGTTGNDTLTGTATADVIVGLGGDDTIYGGGGRDRICGDGGDYFNFGSDHIYGQGGRDRLAGSAGNDFIFGAAGDDELLGGSQDDQLDGGIGNDLLAGGSHDHADGYGDSAFYGHSATAVSVDLSAGTATGEGTDTLINIQSVTGSNYDDTITGDARAEGLYFYTNYVGRAGNDTIRSGGGTYSHMKGGYGNDTLIGSDNQTFFGSDNHGPGYDLMDGGRGNDTLEGGGGPGDHLIGGSGNDVETGGSGNDIFHNHDPQGSDSVFAMGGEDTIHIDDNSTLADYADGGEATDTCYYDSYDTLISCEDARRNGPLRTSSSYSRPMKVVLETMSASTPKRLLAASACHTGTGSGFPLTATGSRY
jgi:Ca2+-binding RTX toxin-like protein